MKRAGKYFAAGVGLLFALSFFISSAAANGKTTIAVMDFQGQDKNLTFLVTETFLTDLSMSGELEIVERNQIDKALDEIKKGQSGYIAVQDAVEAGKMAGAKKIIVGSFFEVEGKIIINARMLDVQTAKIDKALNKEGTKGELTKTIHVLANEFHKILTSQSITGLIPEEKIVNEWQKPPDTNVVTNKPPDTSYVPPSSVSGGEVLLSDDFSYYTGSLIENEVCKVSGGKYVMDYQKDEGKLYWSWTGESFSDFTYSIKASKISGPDKWGYGIVFRVQDVDNGYEFAVSGLGDYYVGKVESGTYHDILKWTVNSAINKGNASNILQVTAKGNTLTFYVNGTLLTTITDSTFSSGRAGTLAYAQVLTHFDDLKVEGPGSAPATPISTNVSSKSSYDDFTSANLFPDNSKVCGSRYEKGEYVFRYAEKGSCYVWILDNYSDFTVSVKARKVKGKDLQGYGVIFRLDEQNNSYYDFIVSGNGDYSIGKFINGEFTELTPWTIHASINKGNAVNFLRVEAKGDMLNFSVNGVLMKTLYDSSLKGGKIGIKSFTDVETAFDEFKVEGK